jgi:hypothetical protein
MMIGIGIPSNHNRIDLMASMAPMFYEDRTKSRRRPP